MKNTTLVKSKKIVENCKKYNLFQDFKGVVNRPVDKKHSTNLVSEIDLIGFIGVIVVVATKSFNGIMQLFIVEGQHRFDAIKKLGIPFDYQILTLHNDTQDNVKRLITGLNSKKKNWGTRDYLNMYEDRYEYTIFKRHIESVKGGVGISDLQKIFLVDKKQYESGKMKFENETKSLQTLSDVKTMLKVLPDNLDAKRVMYKAIKFTGNSKELAKSITKASKSGKKFTGSRDELFNEIMTTYNTSNRIRMVA